MSPSVLYVLPMLARGGPTRGVLGALAALGDPPGTRILSLREADPAMREQVEERGIPLIEAPDRDRLRAELEGADIVQLAFWNTPEAYELLRGPLPPMRLLVWFVVGGGAPPQVILPELVEVADLAVGAGPVLPDGDTEAEVEVVFPVLDPARVSPAPVPIAEHDGYSVGYVGTVEPVKMHPDFVDLCAAVRTPGVRFGVYGSGGGFAGIAARADELGARDRFELGGFVEDVGAVLAGFDVFGYPLCPDNYSATDLALLEAMGAGVPPVILPHGATARVVADGETGIVAADERAYVEALERLGSDRDLRLRLGEAARAHAWRTFSPEAGVTAWSSVYARLMERPKRPRAWSGGPAGSGAELFLDSLGGAAGPLLASYETGDPDADAAVASLPDAMVKGDGGILDYRRRFTSDPHLRLWSGLVLERMGRPALAAGEMVAAARLGIDPSRARVDEAVFR